MPARLPCELSDLIISHVQNVVDLKACSLAAHSLLPRSRYRLFAHLDLEGIRIPKFTQEVADVPKEACSPSFIHSIKSLHLCDIPISSISTVRLPNLTSIHLSSSNFHRPILFPINLRNVTLLQFSDVYFAVPELLLDLLFMAKSLQKLTLDSVQVGNDSISNSRSKLPKLESIRIQHCEGIISSLLANVSSLQELHIDWIRDIAELKAIGTTITHNSSHIRELSLSIHPYEAEDIHPEDIANNMVPEDTGALLTFPLLTSVQFGDIVLGPSVECTTSMNEAIPTMIERLSSRSPGAFSVKFNVRLAGMPLPPSLSKADSFKVDDVNTLGWSELAQMVVTLHRPTPVSFDFEVVCDDSQFELNNTDIITFGFAGVAGVKKAD